MPRNLTEPSSEWLTLAEASRLLGIHPMTLRKWVDAGLVRAFRTPGGHRRFQINEVRDFLDQRRSGNHPSALTASPDQTLAQVRRELGVVTQSGWYLQLSEEQRIRQRELGQRLLGLLLQFVGRQENADHFLEEGRALAHEYGRELGQAGLSASELARAFLFFRRTIINATYHPKGTGPQGDEEGVILLQRINLFMDELLVATLEAYDQVRQTITRKGDSTTARKNLLKSRRNIKR